MHISLRQPSDMVSRFATANDIPYKLVDGNDVVSIANSSRELIEQIRHGQGPRLIELITYRWYGHVDWRDDIDVGVKRSTKDIKNWKLRDPVSRLSKAMIEKSIWSKEQENQLLKEIDDRVGDAWQKALNDPYPDESATLNYVFSRDE